MTASKPILELTGISKSFGSIHALREVDLSIATGEFFGFLGPNGAGKSTLLKVFCGFQPADTGEIRIKGQPVAADDQQARRSLGLVPQELALYDRLSAINNLRVFGGIHGLGRARIEEKGRELLESVGLWERRNDRVKDFSGGMKRRLNIILPEPDILLCDEPTVGVDPQSRNAIFEFLENLNRRGLTILYTTHYMEEAERLCRRIAIIDHGKILACDKQDRLLADAGSGCEVLIKKAPGMEPVVEAAGGQGELIEEDLTWRLVPGPGLRLSRLYAIIEEHGLSHEHLQVRQPSLEGLFLQLTGRKLRD